MKADTVRKALALGAGLAAVAALVVGGIMAGSPNAERMKRFDEERSAALQSISSAAHAAYAENGALPASLDELASRYPEGRLMRVDPRTKQSYGYRILSPTVFELCATFDLPSDFAPRSMAPVKPGLPPAPDYWFHPAGAACWTEHLE